MNGFEWNKVSAAIIFSILVAMVAGFLAHEFVAPEKLEKNAYVVEGVGQTPAATTAEAPKGPGSITALFASASVEAGQKTARVCSTCHSFGKGEPAKLGPNLYGIIGSNHAHMAGFDYSEGMKSFADKPWTYDALNEFLYNPKQAVKGTRMGFVGLKNDQDRANVIAWLRTLSDSPTPLPK